MGTDNAEFDNFFFVNFTAVQFKRRIEPGGGNGQINKFRIGIYFIGTVKQQPGIVIVVLSRVDALERAGKIFGEQHIIAERKSSG